MVYTYTWDETKPAGTRALNLGDDDIREFKSAVRERLQGGGMYFPSTHDENAGLYNYLKFIEQSSNPTAEANRGFLFTKDVSSVTELYWMDSSGNVIQLTTGGKILISSLAIGSEARGDMIVRGASAWGRLAIGAAERVLRSDGTDPSWGTLFGVSDIDVLDGADLKTSGGFTTDLSVTAPTANRTITVPNEDVNLGQQIIKGWVNFNGTGTVAINDHFNVSSITDNGTGDWTVNWSTAFANANYACVVTAGGSDSSGFTRLHTSSPLTTSTARVNGKDTSAVNYDSAVVCVVAIGDR